MTIDNAKLGLHYVQVKMSGYQDYEEMVDVKPKNLATAYVSAVPKKASMCFLLPFASLLLGAAAFTRR